MRGSIACYPPVWGIDDGSGPIDDDVRVDALRTVLFTEAIVTMLGASVLTFGERAIVRMVGAAEGDFRDWSRIRAWADEIAWRLNPTSLRR